MDFLLRLFGYFPTLLTGDTSTFDRWLWLRKHFRRGLRTLDAGCGSGSFTFYAAKHGGGAVGVTSSDESIPKAEHRAAVLAITNVDFVKWDLREINAARERLGMFDQIICFEVIEHIMGDAKLLKDLSEFLRPGGRMYLTTPYKHYRHLYADRLSETEDGGHVRWGYTHEEMKALMAAAGLEVEIEEYITGYVSQKIMNLQRRLVDISSLLAYIVTFPLRPLIVLDYVFRRQRYPALSIGVVAVKKSGD